MSAAEYRGIVDDVAHRVRSGYLFVDVGERCAAALEAGAARGELDGVADLPTLCLRISAIMQDLSGDPHLRLLHHDGQAPDETAAEDYARHWSEQAARTAGGIRSVSRSESNVAVVTMGPFLGLPVYAGTWQAAAMNLCHGADAVILDLRSCVGGTPAAAALISSYFFGPEPVHLSDVVDRSGRQQFWTLTVVPGERLGPHLPLCLLVSSGTFSGGEELAFNLQELGRATVIGEPTRGGAHPRVGVRVHEHVELALPVARPESPRTGKNWEGVGIRPDVVVASERALDRALERVAGS